MTVALVAAVLVCGAIAVAIAALAALRGFELWLAFRREGQRHDSEALADALRRLAELEQRMAGAELQKLRR